MGKKTNKKMEYSVRKEGWPKDGEEVTLSLLA